MQWLESGLREALHRDGAALLEELLNDPELPLADDHAAPGERCYPARSKEVQTLLGWVSLRRRYYHNASQGCGRYPLDQALGLAAGVSPGVLRLICRLSARQDYASVAEDLRAIAGVELSQRHPQRLLNLVAPEAQAYYESVPCPPDAPQIPICYIQTDGTGVPMRRAELQGRAGKQSDGSARTREVKLGCVFTQHQCDEQGRPIRDPHATSYVGSFENARDFGQRLRNEARRRGVAKAQQLVFLGDGAPWIWELARVNFPKALQILDWYHAMEHVHELTAALWPDSKVAQRQSSRWEDWLARDRINDVIAAAQRRLDARNDPEDSPAAKALNYFRNNRQRMAYGSYRQAGYFVGSGVVEAGCKTVVGKRLKESGMHWSEVGAQNVLNFRCALLSGRFDDYWDQRQSAFAA